MNVAEQISKLAELHAAGRLSDAEFEALKARVCLENEASTKAVWGRFKSYMQRLWQVVSLLWGVASLIAITAFVIYVFVHSATLRKTHPGANTSPEPVSASQSSDGNEIDNSPATSSNSSGDHSADQSSEGTPALSVTKHVEVKTVFGNYMQPFEEGVVTSNGSVPLRISRVVLNGRIGVKGCDTDKGQADISQELGAGGGAALPDKTMQVGDTVMIAQTSKMFNDCGETIIKIDIETDHGTAEYNFDQ